jgi:hypothetical protein
MAPDSLLSAPITWVEQSTAFLAGTMEGGASRLCRDGAIS